MFFDGRKKSHVQNFLVVHQGDGQAKYIHGAEPGIDNDITALRRSDFCRNIGRYVAPQHIVMSDGAWRYEGLPFVCRFTDNDDTTPAATIFNYEHSERRVLAENWYCRYRSLWPFMKYFTFRQDKIDIFYRAFAFFTNLHIRHAAPLREGL